MISKVLEWISSDDLPLELKASAALITANIARNGMFTTRLHIPNQHADSACMLYRSHKMKVPKCSRRVVGMVAECVPLLNKYLPVHQ